MRTRTKFIYNTALLTASTLLMRCIGCAFQVWLAGRIGSAGIGLYQLMGSVGGLAVTFAVSGIGFGTMRLVSEELGRGSQRSAGKAVLCCLGYALAFGCGAAIVLYRFAEPIGFLWIEDGRTVLPLRIMAWQLPFVALSSVFTGYFTACGRVGRSTAAALGQQLLDVGLTYVLLRTVPRSDIAQNCACITFAGTVSEAVGAIVLGILYIADRLTHDRRGNGGHKLPTRLLGISLPLAVSAYARSGLSTLQHMLIPSGLRRSGLTAAQALSAYGIVHGMTLTVIYFPTCVLYVVAQLLVPVLTEQQVQNRCNTLTRTSAKMLRLAIAYSAAAAAVLFLSADLIAEGIYRSPEAAYYIRLFVPLVPVIFTDIIVDGCLKGLGQQLWSMGINIAESACGVVLTALLVPRLGIMGFVLVVYFNEILNFALSFWKLRQVLRSCKPASTAV